MNASEIIKLCNQIKVILPSYQVPDIKNMMQDEIRETLGIYIMQFGGLDYKITLRALNNITLDEKKMDKFKNAPIPTLARESVNLTTFTSEEKQKYKDSQEVRYSVDRWAKKMRAWNKANTSIAVPEKDRPMTSLEEDYHIHGLMSYEEYWFWKDKEAGLDPKKPIIMTYNPRTRKNDYNEVLDGFEKIGA